MDVSVLRIWFRKYQFERSEESMGNCCAAKPAHPHFDGSKRPLRPPQTTNSTEEVKSDATTRANSANLIEVADEKKKGKGKDDDSEPLARVNNLNHLEALQPRDLPPSQVNSVQSSTLPGDGSSISATLQVNGTHLSSPDQRLGQLGNRLDPRQISSQNRHYAEGGKGASNSYFQMHAGQSRSGAGAGGKIDKRSMISAVSEFKQDSMDLDENVPIAKEASYSQEKRNLHGRSGEGFSASKQRARANQPKIDLGIPKQPRCQIYKITNEFPVQRPYSSTSEWQSILHKYSIQQSKIINDKPVDPAYDELAESLLALTNRNWIRDQLKMHQENRMAMQDSLSNLVKQRQSLQMREHFTWFVWAVAQYYFGGPDRTQSGNQGGEASKNEDVESSWQFHSRATIPDQDVSGFDDQDQSHSTISRAKTTRQGVTSASQKPSIQKQTQPARSTVFTCKLPKTNSSKWSEGFSFKGVFFRLLPFEDAAHIQEELKALKYIQTELLDLQAQEQTFLQQQADNMDRSHRGQSTQNGSVPMSFSEGHLHKDVILPLLVGVKCCGFYLYGTPLIYTQDLKGGEGRESNNLRGSAVGAENVMGRFGSSMINNPLESETYYPDPFSENFVLPKFSSVNPLEAANYPSVEQLRRGSYGYLHENIDEDTMHDPILQRMPLLKNLSRRNLIPVIDFEEFNNQSSHSRNIYSSGLTNSARAVQIQINYLMVYLASTLRTLSQESTASVLFSVPSSIGDDIVFQPYPGDGLIEMDELDKMLKLPSAGPVSQKPLGDIEEQKSAARGQSSGALAKAFSRRFLAKHGWHCFLIEKKQTISQHATRGAENRRASLFYNLRENSAGGLEQFFENKDQEMEVIVETNEGSSAHQHKAKQTPQSTSKFALQNRYGVASPGPENLESTPRMQGSMGLAGQGSAAMRSTQQIFTTPLKSTVMKRAETNRDEMIYGSSVICANLNKGFKVQYSLTQHTYPNGIDTMFQLSLDHMAKIMETSDRITNIDALKSMMHRKGLNLRFLWVLLTKVKLKQSRDLIMAAILVRTMRRIVNEEVKLGSTIRKPQSTIPFVQASSNSGSYFRRSSHQKTAKEQSLQQTVRAEQSAQEKECYQGNRSQLFRECISLYTNAVMKNKFAKYKQVFNETLLGLFLSRLKIMTLAHSLELSTTQLNYLESKDITNHVLEMPSQNPIMFLNSVQTYFNIEFRHDFARKFRQDKYFILNKPQPIGRSDITSINHKVQTYFSLHEHAYFILARKISAYSYRQRQARINRSNLKDSQASLAKVFSRLWRGSTEDAHGQTFTDQDRTDRINNVDDASWHYHQRKPSNNFMHGSTQQRNPSGIQGDTYRNFKNLQSSAVSGTSAADNYRNIIDLSKSKRSTFKPSRSGEILLPPVFYKLQTTLEGGSNANSMQDMVTGDGFSVFQPFYEMPNSDIVNEWVIVLESLFNEVYSVQGREAVLLEVLTHQCILTLFLEQDPDSSIKILSKIREMLLQTLTCPPELIILCMMLTGVWQDMNEEMDQFPIESEKNFLAALIIAFQVYGDPRGRGNYSIPYYLYFTWKLSLLALSEYKKNDDSEFAEEMFDCTLSSLFNHKRSFKQVQMDLIQAQEQALFGGGGSGGGLEPTPSTAHMQSMNNLNSSTFVRQGQVLHFELTMDHQDIMNSQFDMQKYRRRPQNVVTAGGFVKANHQNQQQLSPHPGVGLASAMKHHNDTMKQSVEMMPSSRQLNSGMKPFTQTGKMQHRNGNLGSQSMNHLQKSNIDAEISDIDVEFRIEDDEDRLRLAECNFRESETLVGKLPFQHWTINRSIISQQLNALSGEQPSEAKEMRKNMIRDQVTKQVDLDAMYLWIVNYNPVMTPTGLHWNSKAIKEAVFCQNTQIVGSSEPSSVTFSSHKMSQYSYRSNSERSALRKRSFLNPYSSYMSKEVGGIQKGEILGQLYSWGTDQYGQIGLEYFITSKQMGAMQSLKILHPRLLVPLKDELIKEVCCGHGHSLAINQFGQMYSWGQNNCGQLGLGDHAPELVHKPVLNTHVANVVKLAAGHEHSLALTKTQELYSWGFGPFTGHGTEENVLVPTHLDLYMQGKADQMTPAVNKIKQIDCYGLHSVVVTQNGELFTWGSSKGGQLGHEEQTENGESCFTKPTRVEYLVKKDIRVAQVSCGETHTVILTTEDQVWGWGLSMYGQLGLGFSEDSYEPGEGQKMSKITIPTEITQFMPPEITVAKIICGAAFTLFLTTEYELYGCGINDLGQLGLETQIEEMQMAVLDRAYAANGGMREVITSNVTVPSRIICFENIKVNTVSCGENHSLALIGEEKSLWSWGTFRFGQLGQGEVTQKMNPRPIQSLHTTNVHKLAAGSRHSMALLGDSNQLTAMTANFFLNSDLLNNPWSIDFRKLSTEQDSASRDVSIALKPKI